MSKYKLISKTTGEEHLCEKVMVDGWDYYVNNKKPEIGDIVIEKYVDGTMGLEQIDTLNDIDILLQKKVIATNNPSIDVPKVVDEIKELGEEETNIRILQHETPSQIARQYFDGFIQGYTKSQETHPFSEEDMIEFSQWVSKYDWVFMSDKNYWVNDDLSLHPKTTKELLQLWKSQQPKTVYYEKSN